MIINHLIKMVYYKLVKVIIDILSQAKVMINKIIHYYGIFEFIIKHQNLLFISKFLSLLYYFLDTKNGYLQFSNLK